jgi:pilus assembly protein Flp/PilA
MTQLQTIIFGRLALMFNSLSMSSIKREEGQTLVEYALILVLIAIVVVGALTILGDKINNIFTELGNKI